VCKGKRKVYGRSGRKWDNKVERWGGELFVKVFTHCWGRASSSEGARTWMRGRSEKEIFCNHRKKHNLNVGKRTPKNAHIRPEGSALPLPLDSKATGNVRGPLGRA